MSALGKSIIQSEQDLIEIPVYYKVTKNKFGNERISILTADEAKNILDGDDEKAKANIEVVNTKWKHASWNIQNKIIQESMRVTPMGESDIDWNKYRDLRVKKLLHSWDLKYEEQAIPVSNDVLDNVPPQFFIGLFEAYEDYIGISEEEKGK